MGVLFTGTVDRMKSAAGLRSDTDLAKALDITPQAISNFKNKGEIPSDLVIQFAVKYKVSVDWLRSGEGEIKRGERAETLYSVAEPGVVYGTGDVELREICDWLKYNPGDKKLISKLIKGRKFTKEALEGLGVKGLVEEG